MCVGLFKASLIQCKLLKEDNDLYLERYKCLGYLRLT